MDKNKIDIDIREYVTDRLAAIFTEIKNIREATALFAENLIIRFEQVNEWRKTVTDMINNFVPRTEFIKLSQDVDDLKGKSIRLEGVIAELKYISTDIQALKESKARLESASTQLESMNKDMEELKISKARMEGMASQRSVTIALIFAIVGTIISIFNLILRQ